VRLRFVSVGPILILVWCAAAVSAAAQSLSGALVSATNGEPLAYGTVVVGDSGREWFTDPSGQFVLTHLPSGTYRMRARQIGFAPIDTMITVGDAPVHIVLQLQPVALKLAVVRITAKAARECVTTGIPDSAISPQLASVFGQLRDNVDRYRILLDEYPFHFRREKHRFIRVIGIEDYKLMFDTVAFGSGEDGRYRLGEMVYEVIDWKGERHQHMYVPSFRDLADADFLVTHCFRFAGREHGNIRIDFEPASAITVPDVEGSIYLDARRYVVRRAVFRLTRPEAANPPILGLTVTTTFAEIVPLVPVVGSIDAEQPLPPLHLGVQRVFLDGIENDRLLDYGFDGQGLGQPAPPARDRRSD
jgi:hypothetical protein